ncbi:MAG TPA: hypothetical protein VF234_09990 [Limnochordia bacterium]
MRRHTRAPRLGLIALAIALVTWAIPVRAAELPGSLTFDFTQALVGSLHAEHEAHFSPAQALVVEGRYTSIEAGDYVLRGPGIGLGYRLYARGLEPMSLWIGAAAGVTFPSAPSQTSPRVLRGSLTDLSAQIGHRWRAESGVVANFYIAYEVHEGQVNDDVETIAVRDGGLAIHLQVGFAL